jgi:hypothetical protein
VTTVSCADSHTWRNEYPEGDGENQSPINLTTNRAVVVNPRDQLLWQNYGTAPIYMNITNDGYTGEILLIQYSLH